MRLNVPRFVQERQNTCAVACNRMVLAYYGVNQSEEDIFRAIASRRPNTGEWHGSYAIEHAIHWQELGFKTLIYKLDGIPQPNQIQGLRPHAHILSPRTEHFAYGLYCGETRNTAPQVRELAQHLRRGNPVIVSASTTMLYETPGAPNWHMVVFTGMERNNALFIDPLTGRNESMPISYFDRALNIYAARKLSSAAVILNSSRNSQ